MKIFYTASYYGKYEYQKQYDLVLDALLETGSELISPELGNYQDYLTQSQIKKSAGNDALRHYLGIKRGIQLADAVVIEITHQDFQIGWEAALAVMNKKPVLCLSLHEDFSEKIDHALFHAAKYSEVTIDNIIEAFVQKISKGQLTERFNMFMSPTQLAYLEQTAKEMGQSSSAYVRELIDGARSTN